MALNISEAELQDLIINSLKEKTFINSIVGKQSLIDKLAHDNSEHFIPSFLVDFKLQQEYARGALLVIESLSDYEIINGETIRSISLEINDSNVNQRLFPDIVLYNEKTRQLIVMELKIEGDTERQAVTELAAFVQEIRNHLPFSSDLDITLIVIAESYKTLLNHAVSGLVLDTRFNILCLRPEMDTNNNLEMHVHHPVEGWTDIGQNFTGQNTFLSKTVLFKPKKLEKAADSDKLLQIHYDTVEMVEDMLLHQGAKFGTHGFILMCGNENGDFKNLALNINLLNPYVFLQFAIESEMPINKEPLSDYLKSKHLGPEKLQETISLNKLVELIEPLASKVFDIEIEETTTYSQNMQLHSDFRRRYVPISFDSWGAVGEYVRYIFHHPAFNRHYFVEAETLSPLAYKQPYLGLQIINLISGDYLFRNGSFNASDTYKFAKLIDFYLQRHIEKLRDEKPDVNNDCTLAYAISDLSMALKEFNIRINTSGDAEAMACPSITLSVSKMDHDFLYEIKEFCMWHTNQFTSHSAITNKMLVKACYDAASYFNPYSFRNTPDSLKDFEKDVAFFMKEQLMFYIDSAYIEKSIVQKDVADQIIKEVYYIDFSEENAGAAISAIMQIENERMMATWDPKFLSFADEVIDEVFHMLPLSTSMFKNVDWPSLKQTIQNRVRRGETHLALLIDSAGNFSIGRLPEIGKNTFADIADYNKEVFFVNNMAGLATFLKVKWEELESGKFFDN